MSIDGKTTREIHNTRKAAERIGVGKSTMEKWRTAGFGPPYIELSPGRIGYLEEDLLNWIESRRREAAAKRRPAQPGQVAA